MKRMELNIALTSAIMFVVAVSINALYNVFTFAEMSYAIIAPLTYLAYIWINTRRHKLLARLGFFYIGLILLFVTFSYCSISDISISDISSNWTWRDTVMIMYSVIAYEIASNQCKKLLEED